MKFIQMCVCVCPSQNSYREDLRGKVANDRWVYKAERASNSLLVSEEDKLVAARRIFLGERFIAWCLRLFCL